MSSSSFCHRLILLILLRTRIIARIMPANSLVWFSTALLHYRTTHNFIRNLWCSCFSSLSIRLLLQCPPLPSEVLDEGPLSLSPLPSLLPSDNRSDGKPRKTTVRSRLISRTAAFRPSVRHPFVRPSVVDDDLALRERERSFEGGPERRSVGRSGLCLSLRR